MRPAHRPAFLTLGALGVATLTAAPLVIGPAPHAVAGPDDGRTVFTQAHVDAPYVAMSNDRLVLQARSGSTQQLGDVVAWVGQDLTGKDALHTFVVPKDPALGFLGKPGDVLYRAPATPTVIGGKATPIWIGFGAAPDLPLERFRDRNLALEILSVDGPGDMEIFSTYEENGRYRVRRMFSTATPSLRGFPPEQNGGTHTHVETTFTKAGRYEVTYRAVARDGKTCGAVQSTPQKLTWQVGGERPAAARTPSTRARYDAASTAPATGYTFTLAPGKRTGSTPLTTATPTTLTFASADTTLQGTATVLVDGYHLTDMPVVNGRATRTELLTSNEASYQVVFTPTAGKTGRWISPALRYAHGRAAVTARSPQTAAFPTPHRDRPDTATPVGPRDVADRHYTAVLRPGAEGDFQVDLTFADPAMRARVTGGFYPDAADAAKAGQVTADVEVDTTVVNGHAVATGADEDYLTDGATVAVRVRPHPDLNVAEQVLVFPRPHHPGQSQTVKGELPASCVGGVPPVRRAATTDPAPRVAAAPQPPALPATGAAKPAQARAAAQPRPVSAAAGAAPAKAAAPAAAPAKAPAAASAPLAAPVAKDETCNEAGATTVTTGHLDLGSQVVGGALRPSLKDDRLSPPVWKDPAGYRLVLGDKAKHAASADLSFVAKAGTPVWAVASTQQDGVPWLGANTMHPSVVSGVKGGVTWTLDSMEGPGKFAMYLPDPFGGGVGERLMDTAGGKRSFTVPANTHQHANWVFTQPGRYVLHLTQSATLTSGKKVSGATTVTFLVGGAKACAPGAAASTPSTPTTPTTPAATAPQPAGGAAVTPATGGEDTPADPAAGLPADAVLPDAGSGDLATTGVAVTSLGGVAVVLLLAGTLLLRARRRS